MKRKQEKMNNPRRTTENDAEKKETAPTNDGGVGLIPMQVVAEACKWWTLRWCQEAAKLYFPWPSLP
jgi:hypothetical protein